MEQSGSPTTSTQQASCQDAQPGFYIDWEAPGVGIIHKDGTKSDAKGDFAITLDAMVEAGSNTGYLGTVKRAIDGSQRKCFFTVDSAACKSKFMAQVNNSFGCGGMSLALNEMQFSAFLQFLKSQHRQSMPICKAACTIGQQPCSEVWMLGNKLIIDADGNIIPEEQSSYIWLDATLLDAASQIPAQDLIPSIHTPLSSSVLSRLLSVMRVSLKHNFISALLVVAGGIMSLHYSTLTSVFTGCPVVVALGPAETGKTTAIKATLAITGSVSSGLYVKGSNAFFMERAHLSSLPFAIDDPPKQTSRNTSVDVNDLIIDLYNGGKTANLRKGSMKPKSIPIIATNYDIKSDARVITRATVIPFTEPSVAPTTDEEEEAFTEFEDMILSGEPSSAIGWAIKQGKVLLDNKSTIKDLKERFRGTFHGRTCYNWAVLLFFVKQLLAAAGQPLELDEVVEHITAQQSTCSTESTSHQEEVVTITLKEVIDAARQRPLKEVLQFMRTGTFVNSHEVVAIVLADISTSLTYSSSEVKAAISSLKIGDTNVAKDFLDPSANTTAITRNLSNRRRKCCTVVMNKLTPALSKALKEVTSRRAEGEEHGEHSREEHGEGHEENTGDEHGEHTGEEYGENTEAEYGDPTGDEYREHTGEEHENHTGEEHGEHAGEERGEHAGEEHGEHAGEERREHAGEERGEERGEHAGEEHGEHAGEERGEHPGEEHGEHAGEECGEHAGDEHDIETVEEHNQKKNLKRKRRHVEYLHNELTTRYLTKRKRK